MDVNELRAECEGCGAAIRTANLALAGKSVKCPKCAKPVRLPVIEDEDEVVPVKRPKRSRDEDEEDAAPRPAKGKARAVAVDEDEDEPVRPKRKGKRKPPAKSNATWLYVGGGVAALVAVVILVVVLTGGKNRGTAGGPNGAGGDSQTPVVIPKAEMTVTPDLFKREYPPGDTSLDKYDGKVVEVEGLFRDAAAYGFSTDRQMRMRLSTGFDSELTELPCRFPAGIDLGKYCPGQKVKVVGTFRKEKGLVGNTVVPFVNDCVVSSTDGVMCPTRTAEELATELAAEGLMSNMRRSNLPNWTSKNRNAYFYLTGKVESVGSRLMHQFYLKTSKGPLEFHIDSNKEGHALDGVERGTEVKILVREMSSIGQGTFPSFSGFLLDGGK